MLLPSRLEALRQLLREEVRARGVIPFARFMDLALYCPELGYYDSGANSVGRRGDFYTNVSVGPLFGELLAFQFARWLDSVPDADRQVVEAGAHDGTLARDLLRALRQHRPDLLPHLEYWIVDPSPRRQAAQRERLREFAPGVRWLDSWQAVPQMRIHGVIFANELLDAMPVHRLGWDARRKAWFEWGVGLDSDRFVWKRLEADPTHAGAGKPPLTSCESGKTPSLQPATPGAQPSSRSDLDFHRWGLGGGEGWRFDAPEVPPELAEVLPDGFITEVCPAAVRWWHDAASRLARGRLLTFDYGLSAEGFPTPGQWAGTLRGYHRHRLTADPLARPGEQDLTAHVNFTAVGRAGEAAGLSPGRLVSQTEFLTGIAQGTWAAGSGFAEWTPGRVRQFQTLTHPEHFGRAFKVLLQHR
jgi:SAM-dependent MidA family methyltransferase